ncbi:hypothetical protein [Halobacterium salinarum]|uniref:hypothetical protein n=1 Tax=Halobacterium salinarum TaxID=2242 RepID=UPI000677A3CB|nr:hypothetical protein [Halobacterium salinarum]
MSTLADTIHIENVVASSDLGQELALDQLSTDLPGAEYNPEDHSSLVKKSRDSGRISSLCKTRLRSLLIIF